MSICVDVLETLPQADERAPVASSGHNTSSLGEVETPKLIYIFTVSQIVYLPLAFVRTLNCTSGGRFTVHRNIGSTDTPGNS